MYAYVSFCNGLRMRVSVLYVELNDFWCTVQAELSSRIFPRR